MLPEQSKSVWRTSHAPRGFGRSWLKREASTISFSRTFVASPVGRAAFYQHRRKGSLSKKKLQSEVAWLRAELERLAVVEVQQEKSITLQGRIIRHLSERLVFIDDPRVEPTNNHAERSLRPLVILRKIMSGSRSRGGGERMASLMSIAETARRHGHRASDFYYGLYTRPPDEVLRILYANSE